MNFYGYLICKPQIPFYPYIHCLAYFIISSFFYHFLPPFLSASLVLAFLLSFPTFPFPFILSYSYLLPVPCSQFLTPFPYSFFSFLSSSCLPSTPPFLPCQFSSLFPFFPPLFLLLSSFFPCSFLLQPLSFLLASLSLLFYPLPTPFISTTMPLLLVLLLWITSANTVAGWERMSRKRGVAARFTGAGI